MRNLANRLSFKVYFIQLTCSLSSCSDDVSREIWFSSIQVRSAGLSAYFLPFCCFVFCSQESCCYWRCSLEGCKICSSWHFSIDAFQRLANVDRDAVEVLNVLIQDLVSHWNNTLVQLEGVKVCWDTYTNTWHNAGINLLGVCTQLTRRGVQEGGKFGGIIFKNQHLINHKYFGVYGSLETFLRPWQSR